MPVVARITLADPKLPHQIRLNVGSNGQLCQVSCNCLALIRRGPMAEVPFTDLKRIWEVYDNPANHMHYFEAFMPGDRTPKENILL